MLLNCGVGEDLRVPWTARRSNQSILKEISSEYSLEGLMRKLKLQYFGHLMRRTDSLEKTLMLGKTEGRRRRDDRVGCGWMALLTQRTWVWASSRSWRWIENLACCSPWGRKESDLPERLNWTELSYFCKFLNLGLSAVSSWINWLCALTAIEVTFYLSWCILPRGTLCWFVTLLVILTLIIWLR